MKKRLTKQARAKMAEAGRKNLQEWHERAQEADSNAVGEIDAFRADLFRELGPNAPTTRRALAENAVMAYASIIWVNKELRKTRNPERMAVVEKASWISGNLTRLLKALALGARPRPRTLADLANRSIAQNEQISAPAVQKNEV